MSQPKPPMSLTARLARMVEAAQQKLDEQDRPPEPPPPPPDPKELALRARQREAEETLGQVEQLVAAVGDRLMVLLGAARKAGLSVPAQPPLPGYLEGYVTPYAAFLGRDAEAGRLVASVVTRYLQVAQDVAKARGAVGRGDFEAANIEGLRGKFLFLCKIKIYFKDYPVLQKFFVNDPASVSERRQTREDLRIAERYESFRRPVGERPAIGAPAPRTAARPTPAAPTGRLAAPKPAVEPALAPLAAKPVTAPLPAAAPPLAVDQAGRLIGGLEFKVMILKAALARQSGAAATGGLLPPPSQRTAENIAGVIAADPALVGSLREFVNQFERARTAYRKKPPDLVTLRGALASVSTYPARVREVPVLGPLLAAA